MINCYYCTEPTEQPCCDKCLDLFNSQAREAGNTSINSNSSMGTRGMETCAKHRAISKFCTARELLKLKELFEDQKFEEPIDIEDRAWNDALLHAVGWTEQAIKELDAPPKLQCLQCSKELPTSIDFCSWDCECRWQDGN